LNVHCHLNVMKEKKNIENLNWELLAKFATQEEATGDDLDMETWLNQSDENREELEKSRQMLEKVDSFYKMKSFDSGAALQNVHKKISPEKAKIIQLKNGKKEAILRFYKYAAIAIIALLLGTAGYYIGFMNQKPAEFNQIVLADNQVLNEYVLPDGTVVALNSKSQIQFPKKFKNNIREVTLSGEAFFDVKPDQQKPFVIHAGNTQVKVLGTSFNVYAYPETETVEIVVETGKVQVIRTKQDSPTTANEVILVPGEKGTLFKQSNLLEKSVNTNPNYIAWKTLDLVFNEVPLHEVVQCLEKVYHIDVNVQEPELNNLLLTARFDNKPVDFILDVVRLTFNLELSEENEQFILSSRNKKQ
jgi:transmembrane sensor